MQLTLDKAFAQVDKMKKKKKYYSINNASLIKKLSLLSNLTH